VPFYGGKTKNARTGIATLCRRTGTAVVQVRGKTKMPERALRRNTVQTRVVLLRCEKTKNARTGIATRPL
jgi:hypothetical protein